MTVNPYTLNSLYNQGVLDYVPYDLYSGGMYSNPFINTNPYMQSAMQGGLYQNYGMSGDSFFYGEDNNARNRGLGKSFNNIPTFAKGLVSGALILGTAILCLKGKKKPPISPATKEGFFSKLKFWKKKS